MNDPKGVQDKLYNTLFNTLLILRDVSMEFKPYSANDIKALIASKMKRGRNPTALQNLYDLEAIIADLRSSFEAALPD